jgi:hypothetical protein
MSYEGYEQHLCQNGHLFDNYDILSESLSCPECKAPSVFYNLVDQTNGEDWGVILASGWETLRLTSDEYETCNLGRRHLVTLGTYRIPSAKELEGLRYHWHSDCGYAPCRPSEP